MNEEQRTMFIKAAGLLGIQMTPEIALVLSKIRDHIVEKGDISMNDLDKIDADVKAEFVKKNPKPDIGAADQVKKG